MDAGALARAVGERVGLELGAGGRHTVGFSYQGRPVRLRFVPARGLCLVTVELCLVEMAALPEALPLMLESNYLLSGTQGGALCYSRSSRVASMSFALGADDADPDAFLGRLDQALCAADGWARRLLDLNTQAQRRLARRLQGLPEEDPVVPSLAPLGGIPV